MMLPIHSTFRLISLASGGLVGHPKLQLHPRGSYPCSCGGGVPSRRFFERCWQTTVSESSAETGAERASHLVERTRGTTVRLRTNFAGKIRSSLIDPTQES